MLPVAIQADPADGTRQMLVVTGTANSDSIVLGSGAGNGVSLTFNGVALGDILPTNGSPFARVMVFGEGGNDVLDARSLSIGCVLEGGSGNDTLYGGIAPDLLARVRLAQGRLEEADSILSTLAANPSAVERKGTLAEILALRARTLEAQGKRNAAVGQLLEALALAEPEGFVRLFVDEGPELQPLLAAAAAAAGRGVTRSRRRRASPASSRIVAMSFCEPRSWKRILSS